MSHPACLLLLSGPLAVGKTTVREMLERDYGFSNVRSSEYLRARAAERGLPPDRLTLQELGDGLDASTDYKWLLDDVARPLFTANPGAKYWLVDAVRKKLQVEHFRAAFGGSVIHAHLTAPEEVLRGRYEERLLAKGEGVEGAYERAIDHDNERSARGLVEVADIVLNTHLHSVEAVVRGIAAFANLGLLKSA